MASALAVGTVASCVLTELIRGLIETTKSVRKCKTECRRLENLLSGIMPDVENLEKRLGELRGRSFSTDQEDIKMVEGWLERLKRAIDLANIEVYRCNSSKLHVDRKLSGKITSMHDDIRTIASDRVGLFLHLGRQLKDLVREESSQHGASLHGSSSHGGRFDYGSSSPNLFSPDSSLHNGSDTSGSGESHQWGGSGAALVGMMSQERNGILQQEEQTRSSLGHSHYHYEHEPPHEERRQTMDRFMWLHTYPTLDVITSDLHILGLDPTPTPHAKPSLQIFISLVVII